MRLGLTSAFGIKVCNEQPFPIYIAANAARNASKCYDCSHRMSRKCQSDCPDSEAENVSSQTPSAVTTDAREGPSPLRESKNILADAAGDTTCMQPISCGVCWKGARDGR